MSGNLLGEENYIHSPSDDIESFFWVLFWAILQNRTASHSDRERQCADSFKNGLRAEALRRYVDVGIGVLHAISCDLEQVRSHICRSYLHLSDSLVAINEAGHFIDAEEEARYWKAAWHGLALEGVYMSLKVLLERFYRLYL